MGCSQSQLDDEEAVQLCKDRRRFIKQAVEQRTRFASGHIAYIHSLERVAAALRDYIGGDDIDEPHELLDSYMKTSSGSVPILSKTFAPTTMELEVHSVMKVNYLRSGGGTPAVSVQERVQSPEMVPQYGIDGFYAMNSSFFSSNNRHNFPPSPQNSQWDFFWNPFSSLDYYDYPTKSSFEQTAMDDEAREQEGIPDLEEDETEPEAMVEDVDDGTDTESETEDEVKDSEGHGSASFEVSKAQTSGHVESSHQEIAIGNEEETPGFTVYVDRRPTSMAEVVSDLEAQFKIVCNAANDVSVLLQAKKAQNLSTSKNLSGKLLNPIALLCSASLSSSSPRLLMNSSSTKDKGYDSSNDIPEDPCMFSGSSNHRSTLERLYAWEKKLYEEVRSGERVRIAYEKKCMQFRDQDVKGEDPSSVDKTRATIRDLHTQMTLSIHSIEVISKRIETLRDEELHPQLFQLVQGLAGMWRVMAECHQIQKRILDEAKILLADTPKLYLRKHSSMSVTDPHRLAHSASSLETELKNWRTSFESWITSLRSYVHALTDWLLRCVRSDLDASNLPCSPCQSGGAHPIFGLSVQWSRHLDAIHETAVLDGISYFAAGLESFSAQQLREDSCKNPVESKETSGNMEVVEVGGVEEVMTPEKMAKDAIRVLCEGTSVAMSSLAEFAIDSSEGYNELLKQWENVKWQHASSGAST